MFSMKSPCTVRRNPHGPARFTGAVHRWICETPDGVTYCQTRDDARDVAREYNAERRAAIRAFEKSQANLTAYPD